MYLIAALHNESAVTVMISSSCGSSEAPQVAAAPGAVGDFAQHASTLWYPGR